MIQTPELGFDSLETVTRVFSESLELQIRLAPGGASELLKWKHGDHAMQAFTFRRAKKCNA